MEPRACVCVFGHFHFLFRDRQWYRLATVHCHLTVCDDSHWKQTQKYHTCTYIMESARACVCVCAVRLCESKRQEEEKRQEEWKIKEQNTLGKEGRRDEHRRKRWEERKYWWIKEGVSAALTSCCRTKQQNSTHYRREKMWDWETIQTSFMFWSDWRWFNPNPLELNHHLESGAVSQGGDEALHPPSGSGEVRSSRCCWHTAEQQVTDAGSRCTGRLRARDNTERAAKLDDFKLRLS